jgi:orotidine-5'-phosphate decarboxylase
MPELIVALDVVDLDEERAFINILFPVVKFFKIGSVLFTSQGPRAIEIIKRAGARAFLDLKFHDIPNTVAGAVKNSIDLGVDMLNIHAVGGKDMMLSASKTAEEESIKRGIVKPIVLGVTVLTSMSQSDLKNVGICCPIKQTVLALARLAKKCGLSGVIAGAEEVQDIKTACGKDFVTVTPGIRIEQTLDDQKRTATPLVAKQVGTDFIVVGRPILRSKNPLQEAKRIVDGIQ